LLLIQEEDLATMAAQQYFIDIGADMKVDTLSAALPTYIPEFVLNAPNKTNNQERWIQLIMHAFRKVSRSPSPKSNSSSVCEGTSETMRCGGNGTATRRPIWSVTVSGREGSGGSVIQKMSS